MSDNDSLPFAVVDKGTRFLFTRVTPLKLVLPVRIAVPTRLGGLGGPIAPSDPTSGPAAGPAIIPGDLIGIAVTDRGIAIAILGPVADCLLALLPSESFPTVGLFGRAVVFAPFWHVVIDPTRRRISRGARDGVNRSPARGAVVSSLLRHQQMLLESPREGRLTLSLAAFVPSKLAG